MDFNDPRYQQFLKALKTLAKTDWYRKTGVLAQEAKISQGYLSHVINGKKQASYSIQVSIAEACGYSYEEFLQLGKSLLKPGEVQEEKTTKPTAIDPAVEILNAALEETGEKINEKQKMAVLKIIREELENKTKQVQEESKESIKRILKAFAEGS